MDIQDASDLICDTFDKWLISEDNNLFKEDNVINALNECLDYYISIGDDSPAFYDDITDEVGIRYQLNYISDRWGCSGRVRFILRVIGEDYVG